MGIVLGRDERQDNSALRGIQSHRVELQYSCVLDHFGWLSFINEEKISGQMSSGAQLAQ
jgi:hypothetical protein